MAAPAYETSAQFICSDSDPEWHDHRAEGIGASEAACIMGKSTFGGPAKMAAIKLGYTLEEDTESELLKWGHRVETPLIEWFREEKGLECELAGSLYRTTNDTRPWMQATLDGRVIENGEPGGIECKLAMFTAKEWERYGVPEQVNIQTQHQMETMEWGFVYTLVLLDGYRPRWARIDRNDEMIENEIVPAEAEWWAKFQAGERIAPFGAPDHEYKALKAMYPNPSGSTIALTDPVWIERFDDWKEKGKLARKYEKEQKALRNLFIAEMQEASTAVLANGQELTLNLTEKAEFTTRATSYRTLRSRK